MKNWSKLMRRLSVVAALAVVLALAAGAPALQAQPEAGTISTGAGVRVWNGHNCPANVPVNISALTAGLGGYETKVAWPAGRFNNTPANVVVTLTEYLTNGGTRTNSSIGGTTALRAVSGDTVKFGDYSWGTGNPPGNSANGQLATVSLLPTATCGDAPLTLSETQLVDINGAVIGNGETASTVKVHRRFDTDGDDLGFITANDVLVVVANKGPWGGGCSTKYQYDTDLDGLPFITANDVLFVVAAKGPAVTCP